MENTENKLFRKKNLKKASEPEKLDRYLRVTGFGPWFTVLAAAIVLAAVFIWVFFGKLQLTVSGAGYCEDGTLLCYISQQDSDEITNDIVVDVGGVKGRIIGIDPALHDSSEVPNDILFLLPDAKWYTTVKLSCPLDDGLYTVEFYEKEAAPASFMNEGE